MFKSKRTTWIKTNSAPAEATEAAISCTQVKILIITIIAVPQAIETSVTINTYDMDMDYGYGHGYGQGLWSSGSN